MSRFFSIVGPTATGKTDLALRLAAQVLERGLATGVDIISADSRQVYRQIPIISGADVPAQLDPRIEFHGVGTISLSDDWSVKHFQDLALPVIARSFQAERLPLVVGGAGLYHQQLLNPELEAQPGADPKLRQQLQGKSVPELQKLAQTENPEKYSQMNESDQQNPRRLLRVIEQVRQPVESHSPSPPKSIPSWQQVTVGLTDELENIQQKIQHRVEKRMQQGALAEAQKVLEKFPNPDQRQQQPGFSATGLAELISYLHHQIDLPTAQAKWQTREYQYAKRQLTWWQKDEPEVWFEVAQSDWPASALEYILSRVKTRRLVN